MTSIGIKSISERMAIAKDVYTKVKSNLDQYGTEILVIKDRLMEMGEITEDIRAQIDRNIKYTFDSIGMVINSYQYLDLATIKKMELIKRLAKGVSYNFKSNGTQIIYEKRYQIEPLDVDSNTRTITIGDKIYQLSAAEEYGIEINKDNVYYIPEGKTQYQFFLDELDYEYLKIIKINGFIEKALADVDYIISSINDDIEVFSLAV